MVKFISTNKEEDFAVFDTNNHKLTTYLNSLTYGDSFSINQMNEYDLTFSHYYVGNIHTVVKSKEEKHLFIFDAQNLYIFDIEKKEIIDVKKD